MKQAPAISEIAAVPGPVESFAWIHPRAWKTDNRTRKYITLLERSHSREADLGILRRSAELMLRRQDERGSFYTDAEYRQHDKIDDQLGGAVILAYYLSRIEFKEEIAAALERAVRFHLEYLVWKSPTRGLRYSRSVLDADDVDGWCHNLWCFNGGVHVLEHGVRHLSKKTVTELRELLSDYWAFLSDWPMVDENPCHNQRVAFCQMGAHYARVIGNAAITDELLAYYHRHLRPLRIRDRGRLIFSEYNQWDVHYGVLSWLLLEHFAADTGDLTVAADADEMALYFNEQVSAGGYCWGGPRNNECGLDEFPHLFASRDVELDLNRLLLPEPSHLWRSMAMDGHNGKGLVERMEISLPRRKPKVLPPTSWHFRKEGVSVCLKDDFKPHLLSSCGLELIPAANAQGVGTGLVWLQENAWKSDVLQRHPPKASEGLRYCVGAPIRLPGVDGVAAMQRGYTWETRQWWIGDGRSLLWIVQATAHASPQWAGMDFILGTPILTRIAGRAVPVSTVVSAEGMEVDTQGEGATLSSRKFLRFGDVMIGATGVLEFNRPSREAFHTFPVAYNWKDCVCSNDVRLKISDGPGRLECRNSLFFAIEIGREVPTLELEAGASQATVASKMGTFRACKSREVWSYAFQGIAGEGELPYLGFRSRP